MPPRHTFTGISPAILVKLREARRWPVRFDFSEDGRTGTAIGTLPIGTLEIGFNYASESQELTLTILKKPMLVPAPFVWAEFSMAIREATR